MAYKHRWRSFPAFTALIATDLISTVALEFSYRAANKQHFETVYIVFQILSVLVQLAVITEVIRIVLKPTGTWVRRAKNIFYIAVALGAMLAFLASLLLQPPSLHGPMLLQLRGDIFTGLLICEAVIAMMVAASEVGLPWKSHVMAVGQGLMVWALLTVTSEGMDAFLDPSGSSIAAYYFRGLVYLGTVSYWTVSLWREEPARQPISPALRKYIVALHDRVQYDLGKAGH